MTEGSFLRWFGHALASALAVLAVLGAFAMWTYDPPATLADAGAMVERMAP